MRVLAIHMNPGKTANACQIYRANTPFYYLNQQPHWDARWISWEDVREAYHQQGRSVFVRLLADYDLFVLPRVAAPHPMVERSLLALIEGIRTSGKRWVYEIDDDYTNQHRDLTSMGVIKAMDVARLADAITVTTPYLAEVMQRETKRPVYVLPNMVAPLYWNQPSRHTEDPNALTVTLGGSVTHEHDWKVLSEVMPSILANDYGRKVTFRVIGYHPDYLRNLPNTEYLPPLDYELYAEIIRQSDVILAPVDTADRFNDSKSPIKVIEGMAASRLRGEIPTGAACIASNNKVYQLAIESGKNGILCSHTPEAWYNAIDSVLRNDTLRHQIQDAGHRWVWKRHDMSRTWQLWASAYQKILSKPANSKALTL
jgi:glycosyltransferase involved in cell wall biosynthesis